MSELHLAQEAGNQLELVSCSSRGSSPGGIGATTSSLPEKPAMRSGRAASPARGAVSESKELVTLNLGRGKEKRKC